MNKLLKKHQDKIIAQDLGSQINRARSITVGTAFGGTTEINMRCNDGSILWCILQPVEVMELIHQLSANIGCHINVMPRQDFSSWRDWKLSPEELAHYRGVQPFPGVGWAPHANDISPHVNIGASLPPPELQPGLKIENDAEKLEIKKPTTKKNKKSKTIIENK